jgi:hypothetical protein
LLGLFAVNWLHTVAHIAIGSAGLASYRSHTAASSYAIGIGVLYLGLFVIGLVLPLVIGLLPLNVADNILHLVSGGLALGLASPARAGAHARTYRTLLISEAAVPFFQEIFLTHRQDLGCAS